MAIRKPLPKPLDPLERWNLLGLTDLSQPLPPVPWVCEQLGLAPGAVALVAGYGYSGKTMALQSLALSVASGKSVWGVWNVRQGRVVHLDYEQGRRLTQERYQRLARGMGLELTDLPAGSLRAAVMPRAYLDNSQSIEELAKIVDGAALVIVDSLRAAIPSADENSSDVRTYLDVLSRVSERTGACIVVIHHARKPSPMAGGTATHTIRGSGALFDACQSVYVLAGEKGQPTVVHHEKDRVRGVTLEDFGLSREDVPGPNGETKYGLRVVHLEAEQMAEAASSRDEAKEDRLIEDAATRIVFAIANLGFAFHGSSAAAKSLVRCRTEVFKAAWTKLVQAGVLIRKGTYRDPIWQLSSDPVPGSDPVPNQFPEPQDNPVPGSPSLREGTGMSSPTERLEIGIEGNRITAIGPADEGVLEARGNLFKRGD